MNEESVELRVDALEQRSRALFQESVENLDMRMRSRLNQARHAALSAADRSTRRSWLMRMPVWSSAAGVSAAAVLGVALWFGGPLGQHGAASIDPQSTFEDLDLVASSDESSGDSMEMLQDDIDFYAWADKAADKAATTEPAA
jgi:negative regulator of sigma E activity